MQSPIFSVCLKELNYQPVAPPLTAVIMNADVTLCYGRVCLPRGSIWQRWKCMAGLQPLEWPVADMDIFPGGLGRNTLWSKWRVDMCQGSKWAAPFWVRWGQRWLPCDLETVIPTLLKYTYMLFFRRKYIFCRTKNEKKNNKKNRSLWSPKFGTSKNCDSWQTAQLPSSSTRRTNKVNPKKTPSLSCWLIYISHSMQWSIVLLGVSF